MALGATAAKALLGSSFRLTQHRGELLKQRVGADRGGDDPPVRDPARAATRRPGAPSARRFAADLRVVVKALS